MVQRFLTATGGGDEDIHLLTHSGLADVIRQHSGAYGPVLNFLILAGLGRNQAI
jgi:hypothetical protein